MTDSEMDQLKARVRELEDLREIHEVWFKFHHLTTGGFNGKHAGKMEALECLTDDAQIQVQGLHEPGKGPQGREQYTEYWAYWFGDAGPLPRVFQTSVSEEVTIDGDTAIQISNMLMIALRRGYEPTLTLSERINHLRRTPDGWRISKTTLDGGFIVDLKEIRGPLNDLPEAEARTPWIHPDGAADASKAAFNV
jgi:ketosteroid isomerase-like protein